DLVPEGATAAAEADPRVAALKASAALVRAVDAAVKHYEQPPARGTMVETPWADIPVSAALWAEAFAAAEPGTPHNEAREQVWDALLDIVLDQVDEEEVPPHLLRRVLLQDQQLAGTFARAWPVLDPLGIVAD